MKRVFLGLLLFVMLFIVSACTGKDTDRETEQLTEDASTSFESDTAMPIEDDAEETDKIAEAGSEAMTYRTEEETGDGKGDEESVMTMKIGESPVQVDWEDNESVEALKSLAKQGDITIQMSMYGGFEQVGSLGESLPRNDKQTTTKSGDIVLYSGNQIVIFYGSNSWAYTRLGHISDKDESQMEELLSNGDETVTISAKN